jgi:HSP20 family protein
MSRTMVVRRGHLRDFPTLDMDRFMGFAPQVMGAWVPAVDVLEDADGYTVQLDVPGLKASDIEVSLDKDQLTISGERTQVEAAEGERWHRTERRTGRFSRTLTLPVHVAADQIDATVTDGVLRVRLPKAAESKPRTIEVRAAIEG